MTMTQHQRGNLQRRVEQLVVEMHGAQAVAPPSGSFRVMLLEWRQVCELVLEALKDQPATELQQYTETVEGQRDYEKRRAEGLQIALHNLRSEMDALIERSRKETR